MFAEKPNAFRAGLLLAVGALLICSLGPVRASTSPPGSVEGGGTRGEWTFDGTVQLGADGEVSGHFQLLRRAQRGKPMICRYEAFSKMMIIVNKAVFDATGTCGDPGVSEVAAHDRVTVVDNGEPGTGKDEISVTRLGPGGASIPKGPIDGGNLQVRRNEGPSEADRQLLALRRLQTASQRPPEVRFVNGFPRGVIARVPVEGSSPVERAAMFLDAYRDLYRQGNPDLGFVVRRLLAGGEAPGEIVTLAQTYRNLPVYGGEIVVVLKGDLLYGTVGKLLTRVALDTNPRLTAREAEDAARRALGEPDLPALGQTTLSVFDASLVGDAAAEPHLAWWVTLGRDPERVFVDAHDGSVLSRALLQSAAFELDLESAEHDANAKDDTCFWDSDDVGVGDEEDCPDNDDFASDPDAINACNISKATYDFYKNTSWLKRDSYDNDGNEIEIFIDSTSASASYAVCDIDGGTDEVFQFPDDDTLDFVMTHEFTHGVVDYGSDLVPGNFPGALNEHLADTFAFLHTGKTLFNFSSGVCRDFANPPNCDEFPGPPTDPDRFSERFTGSFDNGGVHANGGIPNKAAFLLAQGGTHPDTNVTVTGIGNVRMGYLYYSLALGLPSSADFFDERDLAVVCAQQFGYLDAEICSIKNAFGAVEVGALDQNCDGQPDMVNDPDVDFVPDAVDNCPTVANPGQENLDGDSLGDACDDDDDGDGVPEKTFNNPFGDNCPGVYNPDQTDANFNQIGAACDPEEDGDIDDDGVPDKEDNCPLDYNPPTGRLGAGQLDADGDGEGDACDPDQDADGLSNDQDNCPGVANADQLDSDGDLIGDACDQCPNDSDSQAAFGYFKDPISGEVHLKTVVPDSDGDGVPDACDDGGIGRATVTIDGGRYRPAIGPKPDGRSRIVKITGRPGESVAIPIPICLGDCPEAPPSDECVAVEILGLSSEVAAFVADDTADSAGRAPRRGESRAVRFQPFGTRLYYLSFYLSPRFSGESEFRLTETSCALGERSELWTPFPAPPPSLARSGGPES